MVKLLLIFIIWRAMPRTQKPRLLLLIPHLGGGGAERVVETLARFLDPLKYEVHLALIAPSQNQSRIAGFTATVHQLSAIRVRHSAIQLLRLIWRLRPHLILSGLAHLNLLVLALKPFIPRSIRIIVRHNGALAETLRSHSHHFSRRAYSLGYRRADRVICQTEAMAREMQRGLRVDVGRLLVLPNPTDVSYIRSRSQRPQNSTPKISTIVAVGRLVPEKGFDLLLDALFALPQPFDSTELLLAGSGPQQSCLQQQARRLGVRSRIHFLGHVSDPIIRFAHASAFVLSSRTEGLPNALLEAAAAGLPIVATPASAGLVDLLCNREGVWLASDISSAALRVALLEALTTLRAGQRFLHRWIEPYELPRAIASYESAIDHVLSGSAR